jgi:hypothetical protein
LVEEPSHLKQLSIDHVCKIGLSYTATKAKFFPLKIAPLFILRGLKSEVICSTESCAPLSSFSGPLPAAHTTENAWFPDFLLYWLTLWACCLLSQQQTLSLMLVVVSSYTAATASLFLSIIYLVLGSCTVRSHSGLPELMYHITYILQSR